MMDSPTRVGIIGVGGIGTAYASAIGGSPTLSLTAICDTDSDRAAAVGSGDAVVFDSVRDLAVSGTCDMVVIATPPATHAGIAAHMLRAGLDVLCEKPFSIELSDAIEMLDVALTEGRLLTMASKFRYVSDLCRARELIRAGRIGDPVTADVTFASSVDMANRWNSDPSVSGGGVLIDNGTHAVDVIRYLLGPIERVSAMRGISRSAMRVEDTGVVLAETVDRAVATITVSWLIAPLNPNFVTIHGTEGSLEIGWGSSQVREAGSADWVPFGTGYSKMDALRANVENFAATRRGVEELRISPADVLASVAVIASIYDAIETGQWRQVRHQPAWEAPALPDAGYEAEPMARVG